MKFSVAIVFIALWTGCVLSSWKTDEILQKPATGSSENCGKCHQKEYATWKSSRHAHSASNEIFRSDFMHTPRKWCLQCHAPGATTARVRFGSVTDEDGIGCLQCHLDEEGRILGIRSPTPEGRGAHLMIQSPSLRSAEFCGRCHQFNFPRPGTNQIGHTPMQNTLEEWRTTDSGRAGRACQTCHMRNGTHSMPGSHDVEWMRKSVRFSVSRSNTDISVRAESLGAGHAIPTGDVTRLIILQLCEDESCDDPSHVFRFGRQYAQTEDDWVLVEDTTIPPPSSGRVAARTMSVAHTPETARAKYWKAWLLYAPQLEHEIPLAQLRAKLAQGVIAQLP